MQYKRQLSTNNQFFCKSFKLSSQLTSDAKHYLFVLNYIENFKQFVHFLIKYLILNVAIRTPIFQNNMILPSIQLSKKMNTTLPNLILSCLYIFFLLLHFLVLFFLLSLSLNVSHLSPSSITASLANSHSMDPEQVISKQILKKIC